MAKPIKHRDKWRIRWVDENGKRRSEVYETREHAELMLQRHTLWVKEIKLGLRSGICPDKTFNDLADFWLEKVCFSRAMCVADDDLGGYDSPFPGHRVTLLACPAPCGRGRFRWRGSAHQAGRFYIGWRGLY